MQKWEYKTVKMDAKGMLGGVVDVQEFDGLLNQLVSCPDSFWH